MRKLTVGMLVAFGLLAAGTPGVSAGPGGPQADAGIGRVGDSGLVGFGVLNTTGANQTRRSSVQRGNARQFDVQVQNSGNETGRISIKGCDSSNGFRVRYVSPFDGSNITSRVLNGTYGQNRDQGATVAAVMVIKATRHARIGRTKVCRASGISATNRDVVKAELTVKRG